MSRLINDRVVVEMLHNVNLPSVGPWRAVERPGPDRRPGPTGTVQPGTHLDSPRLETMLVPRADSTRKIRCRIGLTVVVDDSPQNKKSVTQVVTPFIGTHILESRGFGPRNLTPHPGVEPVRIEILLPGQFPAGLRGRASRQQNRQHRNACDQQQNHSFRSHRHHSKTVILNSLTSFEAPA